MVKLIVQKIPKKLQGILWSRDISKLDLKKDKNYIIHQVLMYGSLEQIKWLKSVYPNKDIKAEFEHNPKKIYTNSAYNFAKNYLLGINKRLAQEKYVKTAPRSIR